MSRRSRGLPRRSCQAVPASNDRFVRKAPTTGADMVFLDLEDSVVPAHKASARGAAARAVAQQDWGDTVVGVRVNAWSTPWTTFDLCEVVAGAGDRLDVVLLPKVESAAEVVAADLVLRQAELAAGLEVGRTGLEVQIESARGLARVEDISGASARLEAVIFGPADFAASVGMPDLVGGVPSPDHPGDQFHDARARILVAGRMHGLQVIDGPYMRIDDLDGLETTSRRVRALGYDGRWSVHPAQVPVVNAVFTPDQGAFDRALEVLAACDAAARSGAGAARLDDEVIDEVSRAMASQLVARGRRCGLTPTEGSQAPAPR